MSKKPTFSKYGGAFAFADSARKGEFLDKEYVSYTVNRIISGGNPHLANLINEVSSKTVGKEIMAELTYRYFRDFAAYSQYFKIGKSEDKQNLDKLASKLSDITGYPVRDSVIYIEKGMYKAEDIEKDWNEIFAER